MTSFVKVLVPVPLKKEFTYSFDSEKYSLTLGMRVMVPFGSRKCRGYVVQVLDKVEDEGY
ncbi:MAG: hypothetical protein HUK24_03275, partial [Sphaerochaetaceae bacterium]|nr:hypothetical protein [Sphaerochaetaceae bacterium]